MDVLPKPNVFLNATLFENKHPISKHLPTFVVTLFSIGIALYLWSLYLPNYRQLWTDTVHDRNAHLELGLGLASDIAHGRVVEVIRDIDKAKTWPPLHDGVMIASTMLGTGMDIRFAVVPSLAGFVITAIFAFLLAQRLLNDNGWIAGMVATLFVLVSPAQRAFATDVMLESLGAGLTMAALYAAVRVMQNNQQNDWRWLAIALSGLFFLKYNYWLLVVIALIGGCILTHSSRLRDFFVSSCLRGSGSENHEDTKTQRIHKEIISQFRHPLNWLVVIFCAFGFWIKLTGGTEITIFGKTLALRSSVGIATAGYWLFLVRLTPTIYRQLKNSITDSRWTTILEWHLIPVALWLAWPQKLASFLWVLNPSDNVGEFPATSRWEGFPFLTSALASDYHMASWSFILIALLLLAGFAAWMSRQLRPGAIFVVLFLLISIWLTATHPNRKSRFAHSWVPAMWVLAGVGAGSISRRSQYSWQPVATAAGLTAAVLHLPGLVAAPHAPEGGIQHQSPSALTVTESYLRHLELAQRPAIVSNVPMKFLARWTYLDRFGRGIRPITEIPDFDSRKVCSENVRAFQHWVSTTNCDMIVYADFPATSPWFVPVPGCQGLAQIKELMENQKVFVPLHALHIGPDAIVYIWKK